MLKYTMCVQLLLQSPRYIAWWAAGFPTSLLGTYTLYMVGPPRDDRQGQDRPRQYFRRLVQHCDATNPRFREPFPGTG